MAAVTSRGFELRDTATGRLLNSMIRTDPRVWGLCWSPDGKRLGILGRTIEIWNPMGSSPERRVAAGSVNDDLYTIELGWSPDRRRIALAMGLDIVLYDLAQDRRIPLLGGRTEEEQRLRPQQGFSWSPTGGELAVIAGRLGGESIDIWDVGTMTVTRSIPVGKLDLMQGLYGLAGGMLSPLWQVQGGLGYPTQTSRVAWSPDSQVLAVASVFTGLSLWDARTGRLLVRVPQNEQATLLSWASDSQMLYVGGDDRMWHLRRDDAEPVFTIAREALSCDVSRDGRLAAAIGFGGTHLSLWRGREAAPSVSLSRESLPRGPLTLSPDMREIAAPSGVWDLPSGKKLADFGPGGWPDSDSVWSPDAQWVAIVKDGWLKVAHLVDGGVRSLGVAPLTRAHWSPDSKRILIAGYKSDRTLTVESGSIGGPPPGTGVPFWTATGEFARLALPDGFFTPSPDLRYAFSKSINGLTVWDVQASREAIKVPPGSQAAVISVAWSPDSRHIAAMIKEAQTWAGVVEVWDVVTARPTERWTASGYPWSGSLMWRDKLTVLEDLGGAVRIWRAP